MGDSWGSDTEASMPEPPPKDMPSLVDLGGFSFTAGGISHNLTESEVEEIAVPTYAPEGRWES